MNKITVTKDGKYCNVCHTNIDVFKLHFNLGSFGEVVYLCPSCLKELKERIEDALR